MLSGELRHTRTGLKDASTVDSPTQPFKRIKLSGAVLCVTRNYQELWYTYKPVLHPNFEEVIIKMNRWGRRLGLISLCVVALYFFLSSLYDYYPVTLVRDTLGIMEWYNYSEDGLNGPSVSMDNPDLIAKMRNQFIIQPPNLEKHVYHLDDPLLEDPSMGQSLAVLRLLKNKQNGYYIECGALDGEIRSNTLYMERYLNWSGLLIEADPLNFEAMLKKNRKAWISPSCLSLKVYPEIVTFEQNHNMGKVIAENPSDSTKTHVSVQCFPIYSYFLALNITEVDYFSLDVEGAELAVLKTMPFHKVKIKVLSVEFAHVPEGKAGLKEFMETKGYTIDSEITHHNNLANDFIFVRKDLL